MSIQFTGLPTEIVQSIRASMTDAYVLPVETARSPGTGIPCRHCLTTTPKGEEYLILAHRPFTKMSAYAETGPIFLCAAECAAHRPSEVPPQILTSPAYIIRAYSIDERIVYRTGRVTPTAEITVHARNLLADPCIAFVDVRSAANNCFQCRILRA